MGYGTLAGAVMLSGMVIVFLGLVILIVLTMLSGKLLQRVQAAAEKKATEKASPAAAMAAVPVRDGISGETVAAISAAVAAVMSESAPGASYAITGIRRQRDARPVWGFVGVQQNTRPF